MSAYRPEPEIVQAVNDRRLIWRPWMSRLGTVLLVAASPVAMVGGMVAVNASLGDRTPLWAVLFLTVLTMHLAMTVVGIAIGVGMNDLTARSAIRLAWAAVVYPYLGIVRVARWVAYGGEERE